MRRAGKHLAQLTEDLPLYAAVARQRAAGQRLRLEEARAACRPARRAAWKPSWAGGRVLIRAFRHRAAAAGDGRGGQRGVGAGAGAPAGRVRAGGRLGDCERRGGGRAGADQPASPPTGRGGFEATGRTAVGPSFGNDSAQREVEQLQPRRVVPVEAPIAQQFERHFEGVVVHRVQLAEWVGLLLGQRSNQAGECFRRRCIGMLL